MSNNINQFDDQIIDTIDFITDTGNITVNNMSDDKTVVDFITNVGSIFNDVLPNFDIMIKNKTYDNIVNTAYDIRQFHDPKMTSLMVACYISHNDDCLDIIKQLLKVGMQINLTNSQGLTALDMVIHGNNIKIIEYLLNYGAIINVK
nr:ankyrin repeat protein [Megavirus caiporensis]